MSYIPKYILKRMLPADCCKAVAGGVEITMVNVISPISIDEVPDNVLDYVDVKVDGKALDTATKSKVAIEFEGQKYTLGNAKAVAGKTIPVGGTLKVFAPVSGLKKGETHKVEVIIKLDNPIQIEVERTLV
jgi:hypothetical protein